MEITPLTESSMSLVLANMLKNGASFDATNSGILEYSEASNWDTRTQELTDDYRWFTGDALDERLKNKAGKDNLPPLRYPLQINPFKDAARLHAFALWGMVKDNSSALVQTRCEPRLDENLTVTDGARKISAWADYVLADIDYENSARAMDIDMGLITQALGGVVLKVSWVTQDPMRPSGIRYDYFDPRNFYCRYAGRDYWNPEEAWIRTKISADDAKRYGVKVRTPDAYYLEYWNRESMWAMIDGYPAELDGKRIEAEHGFGFVPIIYVPHERVNDFWGKSIIRGNVGLVKELNSREADIGDAVHFGVNNPLFGRNIRGGGLTEKAMSNGDTYYDTGRNQQGEDKPEMYRAAPPDLPNGTKEFVDRLRQNIEKALITPSIAYGEEEGSQRSGQTLYNRMWPLLSHVLHERIHWSEARNRRAEYALKILEMHGQVHGITKEHTGLRKRQLWAPMVPVDRAALIDELVKRKQETMLSLEHALEMVGDVPDIQEEVKKIWADAERMAEIEAIQTKMTTDSQESIADKQIKGQKDLANTQADNQSQLVDQQAEHQSNMADKTAKTSVAIAKTKPAGKPAGGK